MPTPHDRTLDAIQMRWYKYGSKAAAAQPRCHRSAACIRPDRQPGPCKAAPGAKLGSVKLSGKLAAGTRAHGDGRVSHAKGKLAHADEPAGGELGQAAAHRSRPKTPRERAETKAAALNDDVCGVCELGGDLICCEGRCCRSFHLDCLKIAGSQWR